MDDASVLAERQKTADEVYGLLARQGDLSVTQISGELLISRCRVKAALQELEEQGFIAPYPDPGYDPHHPYTEELVAWGLPRFTFRNPIASLFGKKT